MYVRFPSSGVILKQNAFVESRGTTVDVRLGTDFTLDRNIAFGTKTPSFLTFADQYALCSFDASVGVNFLSGNVAAGSESEGFCMVLPDCATTAASAELLGNEAHSNVNGFLIVSPPSGGGDAAAATTTTTAATCVALFGCVAWHNSYAGVLLAAMSSVKIQQPIIFTNHIGLYTGIAQSFATIVVSDATFGGRPPQFDSYACEYFRCRDAVVAAAVGSVQSSVARAAGGNCLERQQRYGDEVSMQTSQTGIVMGSLSGVTFTPSYRRTTRYLPLLVPPLFDHAGVPVTGSVRIDTATFAYFNVGGGSGRCDGAIAMTSNPLSLAPVVPHALSKVNWVFSNDEGRVRLYLPSVAWTTLPMCEGRMCDALQHAFVQDVFGNFSGTGSAETTILANYPPPLSGVSCRLEKSTNTFVCPNARFAQLRVGSLDADRDRRSFDPLLIQDQESLAVINSASQPPDCGTVDCEDPSYVRPGFVITHVALQRTLLVDFSAEAPRRTQWLLSNCPASSAATDSVLLRVSYPWRLPLTVWAPWSPDRAVAASDADVPYGAPAGTNYFETTDSRLYVLLRCDQAIEIHQIVTASVTFRLAIAVESFSALIVNFREQVANALALDTARVQVTEVYPSFQSTYIRIRVDAEDSANYNETAQANSVNARVMNLITTPLAELSAATQVTVTSIESVQWAVANPSRPIPNIPVFGVSLQLIIAIIACACLAALLWAGLSMRLYQDIIRFREYDTDEALETAHNDAVAAAGNTAPRMLGAGTVLGGGGDERGLKEDYELQVLQPRSDLGLGIRSLRIAVELDEDETAAPASFPTSQSGFPSAAASSGSSLRKPPAGPSIADDDDDGFNVPAGTLLRR